MPFGPASSSAVDTEIYKQTTTPVGEGGRILNQNMDAIKTRLVGVEGTVDLFTPPTQGDVPNITLNDFLGGDISSLGIPKVSHNIKWVEDAEWATQFELNFLNSVADFSFVVDNGSGGQPLGAVSYGDGVLIYSSQEVAGEIFFKPANTPITLPTNALCLTLRSMDPIGGGENSDVGVGIIGSNNYMFAIYRQRDSDGYLLFKYNKGGSITETDEIQLEAPLPANSIIKLIHNGNGFFIIIDRGNGEEFIDALEIDGTSFYDMYTESTLNGFSPGFYCVASAKGQRVSIGKFGNYLLGSLSDRESVNVTCLDGGPLERDNQYYFMVDAGAPTTTDIFLSAATRAIIATIKMYDPNTQKYTKSTAQIFTRNLAGQIFSGANLRFIYDPVSKVTHCYITDWGTATITGTPTSSYDLYHYSTTDDLFHGIKIINLSDATKINDTLPWAVGEDHHGYDPDMIKIGNTYYLVVTSNTSAGPMLFSGPAPDNFDTFVGGDFTHSETGEGARFFTVGGHTGIMCGDFTNGSYVNFYSMTPSGTDLVKLARLFHHGGGSAPDQCNLLAVKVNTDTQYHLTGFINQTNYVLKPQLETNFSASSSYGADQAVCFFPFNEGQDAPTTINNLGDPVLNVPTTLTGTGTETFEGYRGSKATFSNAASNGYGGHLSSLAKAPTTTFSLLFQIKVSAQTNEYPIFGLWNGPAGNGAVLAISTAGKGFKFFIAQNDDTTIFQLSNVNYTDGGWHNVMMIADGTHLHLYVDDMNTPVDNAVKTYDGTLKHVDDVIGVGGMPNSGGTGIFTGYGPYDGDLGFVYMTKTVLNASQANTIFNSGGAILFGPDSTFFRSRSGVLLNTCFGRFYSIKAGTYAGQEFQIRKY